MRAPNRIYMILSRLTCAWMEIPDMRLGQLLCNVASHYNYDAGHLFYMEDDELIEKIEEYVAAQINQS